MPFGYGNLTSSDGFVSGQSYTRLRGPILVGQAPDNCSSGPVYTQPPHVLNVSTARADMLVSINSTFAGISAGVNVTTSAPAGLVYISMSTGAGNLIAAGSTANAPTGLPGGANGAALCWDAAKLTLAVYDPGSSAWLWPHWSGSSGATIVWSATSS